MANHSASSRKSRIHHLLTSLCCHRVSLSVDRSKMILDQQKHTNYFAGETAGNTKTELIFILSLIITVT